jgi:hypothetical protein
MLASSGCSHPGHNAVAPVGAPATGVTESSPGGKKLGVTLQTGLEGKVSNVDPAARYVILSFPVGSLPALEQKLYVYHHGLKTAELRVSGPQLDDTIVADILSGQVSVGDRVSPK